MHSPATDFDRHERVIRELIVKAYEQCKRFLDYLGSAREVPLCARVDNQFVEVARLRRDSYRVILPIGLTVESFTPFSAMCKDFPEIQPLLGKHPFVSMSVDDLFVLDRFLPTTGALLHYLEVRQQVAGIRRAMLFDEIDHLGACRASRQLGQNAFAKRGDFSCLSSLDQSLLVDGFAMRTGRSDSPRALRSNFVRLPAMPGRRRHVA